MKATVILGFLAIVGNAGILLNITRSGTTGGQNVVVLGPEKSLLRSRSPAVNDSAVSPGRRVPRHHGLLLSSESPDVKMPQKREEEPEEELEEEQEEEQEQEEDYEEGLNEPAPTDEQKEPGSTTHAQSAPAVTAQEGRKVEGQTQRLVPRPGNSTTKVELEHGSLAESQRRQLDVLKIKHSIADAQLDIAQATQRKALQDKQQALVDHLVEAAPPSSASFTAFAEDEDRPLRPVVQILQDVFEGERQKLAGAQARDRKKLVQLQQQTLRMLGEQQARTRKVLGHEPVASLATLLEDYQAELANKTALKQKQRLEETMRETRRKMSAFMHSFTEAAE